MRVEIWWEVPCRRRVSQTFNCFLPECVRVGGSQGPCVPGKGEERIVCDERGTRATLTSLIEGCIGWA